MITLKVAKSNGMQAESAMDTANTCRLDDEWSDRFRSNFLQSLKEDSAYQSSASMPKVPSHPGSKQSTSYGQSGGISPTRKRVSPSEETEAPKSKRMKALGQQESSLEDRVFIRIPQAESEEDKKVLGLVARRINKSLDAQMEFHSTTEIFRDLRSSKIASVKKQLLDILRYDTMIQQAKEAQPFELAIEAAQNDAANLREVGSSRLADDLVDLAKKAHKANVGLLIEDRRQVRGKSPEMATLDSKLLMFKGKSRANKLA